MTIGAYFNKGRAYCLCLLVVACIVYNFAKIAGLVGIGISLTAYVFIRGIERVIKNHFVRFCRYNVTEGRIVIENEGFTIILSQDYSKAKVPMMMEQESPHVVSAGFLICEPVHGPSDENAPNATKAKCKTEKNSSSA